MQKTFLFFIGVFLLFSCEEQINYIPGNVETLPVVNCIFTNDSVFKVWVGTTNEVFSYTKNILEIKEIFIEDNFNNKINLKKIDDYLYISDSVAKLGRSYNLHIETKNFGELTATSFVPSEIPTIDTAYITANIFKPFDSHDMLEAQLNFNFYDIPNNDNYYEINIYKKSLSSDSPNSPYLLKLIDLYSNDIIIKNENIQNSFQCSFVFSNKLFKNQKAQLILGGDFCGNENDSIIIVLKNVTKDYYLYRKSVKQNINSFDFFSLEYISNMYFVQKQIPIHSNINNGLGIFAGYNNKFSKIIKSPNYILIPL